MHRVQHIIKHCALVDTSADRDVTPVLDHQRQLQTNTTNAKADYSQETAKVADLAKIQAIAFGYIGSKALFSALDIGVFDALSVSSSSSSTSAYAPKESNSNSNNNNNNVSGIAKRIRVGANALEVLLKTLVELGLLTFHAAQQTYSNTTVTERYMVSTNKNYFGDYYKNQIAKQMYPRMFQLSNILLAENDNNNNNNNNASASVSASASAATISEVSYESWFKDKKEAALYSLSQHNGSMMTGILIFKTFKEWFADYASSSSSSSSSSMHVLDVGGGTGAVSIGLCMRVPSLIAHVLDLPNVIETARESIVPTLKPDIARRVHYYAGSALADVWNVDRSLKMDVVLFSYLLVSIPYSRIDELCRRARQSLKKGGRIIIHDFIFDESVAHEKEQTITAFWLLQHVAVNSKVGLLTPQRLIPLLKRHGFGRFEVKPALPHLTSIISAIVV